ncbi:MAG: hypothetical protein HW421_2018 [Ignavibacteria bacterium]|nr:hypothetical protein [Ignavibacteria bacterium]
MVRAGGEEAGSLQDLNAFYYIIVNCQWLIVNEICLNLRFLGLKDFRIKKSNLALKKNHVLIL